MFKGARNSSMRISPGRVGASFFFAIPRRLVVVDDFNFVGITISPREADSPPIVHTDRVLSDSIPRQLLETIPRGDAQVLERLRRVDDHELSLSHSLRFQREPSHSLPGKDSLCIPIPEASNHSIMLAKAD